MPGARPRALLEYLTALGSAGAAEVPDGELLDRFVRRRDQAAFTALLQRYGRLVWGVCRRALREEQEAEGAFQATWLILVRKAGSVRKRASIGSWLHGVAYRVAARARARQAARRTKEREVAPRPAPEALEALAAADQRAVLDEEIQRLPEKYRLPLVLCHLEGLSHGEAARQLSCPPATVATWLARAREQLRGRLARRGLAPSAGALSALLTQEAAAAVPAALGAATTRVVSVIVVGGARAGAVSGPVAALAEGVLRATWITRLKTAAALVLGLAVLGGGVGLLAPAATQPAPPGKVPHRPKAPAPAKPKDGGRLSELLQKRSEIAKAEFDARHQEWLAGRGTQDILLGASRRLLQADLERARTKAERLAARKAFLDRATEVAKLSEAGFEAGRVRAADHYQAEFYRLDAEIELEREKGR
jgi:RNA polymerase sigma factor (sigma-70 family)